MRIMTENRYLPEGMLIRNSENRDYLSGVSGLERAMASGRILESTAVLCDGHLNLTVDLGGNIQGIMKREEVVYNSNGESPKDIAIISRVGKPICFKVLAIEKEENGETVAILSRRMAQIECIRSYLMDLESGDIIPAKITHLEHFGAFVDIGCGIPSLLSIDCISVSRISHPKDRFYVGMPIKAVVKSIDYENCRIYVTHKELLGTWEENASHFCVGQTVMGIVRSVEEYGIFIELSPNLAGLAEYREGITIGQTVAVYIKNIIPERMKIKLVIIDLCKSENSSSKLEYFVSSDSGHMDYWRYSPVGTSKIIESKFSS
jgi:small subunit ribosomal protein S1